MGKRRRGVFAVGVEADVLPALGAGAIAVVRDGGAGEVEGAAVGGGDYFYGVGVANIVGGAGDFEGGDFDVGLGEGFEQGGDVFGAKKWFVALDIDVDVGGMGLGDGVEAIGSAGEVGRGELDGPVVLAAEGDDFFGVGGDKDGVELRAGAGGLQTQLSMGRPAMRRRTLPGRRLEARRAGMTPRMRGFSRCWESAMMEAGCAVTCLRRVVLDFLILR